MSRAKLYLAAVKKNSSSRMAELELEPEVEAEEPQVLGVLEAMDSQGQQELERSEEQIIEEIIQSEERAESEVSVLLLLRILPPVCMVVREC